MTLPEVQYGLLGDVVPSDRARDTVTDVAEEPSAQTNTGLPLVAEHANPSNQLAVIERSGVRKGFLGPHCTAPIAKEIVPKADVLPWFGVARTRRVLHGNERSRLGSLGAWDRGFGWRGVCPGLGNGLWLARLC